MIERVHEHLTGELAQNTRTDTVFVVTAILLNLVILAVNAIFASSDGGGTDQGQALTPGRHTLYVEILDRQTDTWHPAAQIPVTLARTAAETDASATVLTIREEPAGLRYQLDSRDPSEWAMTSEQRGRDPSNTIVMFLFILLQLFVCAAAVVGLLRGKRMRLVILEGLLRMYRDQKVDAYYSDSLLRGYSVRYHVFVLVIALLGVVSIAVPVVVRFL